MLQRAAFALGFALFAGPAFSLTSDQIWSEWQAYISGQGGVLAAQSVQKNGAETVYSAVRVDGLKTGHSLELSSLKMVEGHDGSVALYPEVLVISSAQSGGSFALDHDGLIVKIYEDPIGRGYGASADKVTVHFNIQDEFPPLVTGMTEINAFDLRLSHTEIGYDLKSKFGKITYDYTYIDHPNGIDTQSIGTQSDVTLDGQVDLPKTAMAGINQLDSAFRDGLSFRLNVAQNAESSGREIDRNPAFPSDISYVLAPLSYKIALDQNRFALKLDHADVLTAQAQTPLMPTPIGIAAKGAHIDMDIPLKTPEEGADYRVKLGLDRLQLDPALWAALDPEKALRQDAASLSVDFFGRAQGDFFQERDPLTPYDYRFLSLDVREILLTALGARISATGQFTYAPQSNGAVFPVGKLDVDLKGVNGLLAELAQTGQIAPAQMAGMQFMLAFFARPQIGGQDHMTSQIDARADGSIFVSGQKIR